MGVLRLWGLWWNLPPNGGRGNKKKRSKRSNSSSPSSDSIYVSKEGFQFPYKQAATAASLTLTGDTIAQFRDKFDRWRKNSGDAEADGKVAYCNFVSFIYCLLEQKIIELSFNFFLINSTRSIPLYYCDDKFSFTCFDFS